MKKIWLSSIILGLLTALTVFAYISQQTKQEAVVVVKEPAKKSSEAKPSEKDENNKDTLPITYGKRALTIAADEVQGLAGVLKKDDYVDVISLTSPESGEASSQIILEQIKVLSVGSYRPVVQSAAETEKAPSVETVIPYAVVTLEVLPQQGADLALAAEKGKIILMLRSRKDPTTVTQAILTSKQLTKGEMAK